VILLLTSPRVPPGLMSWPAWQAVATARRILASADDVPLVGAVRAAGFAVEVEDPARLLQQPGEVVWLASDDEAARLPRELAEAIVTADSRGAPELEVLHASYDVPGARLLDLVAVMDRLRDECPWDREQTHRSLARYLLEECYETLEAIERDDREHLREELGDLLLQVFFHSRIAAEDPDRGFTIDDVAAGIVDKLVYRHPHVFAGLEVADAAEVDANWEALKAAEKQRSSLLEGIPEALPALALADKVLGRLAKAGAGTGRSDVAGRAQAPGDDVGDRLLGLVREARERDVDPEQALRDAVRRLTEG
jgi:XTP/dITP diphosphohydrolase